MKDISEALASARLGLVRGSVDLAESEASWSRAFTAIEPELRAACADVAVDLQHVGSTSVPGLRAKPILDVVIGVRPDAVVPAELVTALVSLGFIDRGSGDGSVGRLLVWELEPDARAMHVHIVGHGTREWNDYVEFRDALRADSNLLREYERIKDDLAERYPDDRAAYTSGKDRFIKQALRDASPDIDIRLTRPT